jgi:hypothetical protein
MKNQRNAIVWALVSWLVRRWLRQRTARVTSLAGGTVRARGGMRSVLGALALVGVLAGAFVAWRKLVGESEEWETSVDVTPEPAPVGDALPA